MAGPGTPDLAIAVCEAGGLGSLPCALLNVEQARDGIALIRSKTRAPININFFCHVPPQADAARSMAWRARLAEYYVEYGLDPEVTPPAATRHPFDSDFCAVVEEFKPEVVSFHFGLPDKNLFDRVKATGAKVMASATTVAEAR
jgi:nitronate monooxygenase